MYKTFEETAAATAELIAELEHGTLEELVDIKFVFAENLRREGMPEEKVKYFERVCDAVIQAKKEENHEVK